MTMKKYKMNIMRITNIKSLKYSAFNRVKNYYPKSLVINDFWLNVFQI